MAIVTDGVSTLELGLLPMFFLLLFTLIQFCAAEINDLWALARETHKLSQLCFICSVLPYLAVLKVVEVGCLLFCVLAQKKLVSQILD